MSKNSLQRIWGIALLIAGIGVFVRVPQVMPKLAQIEQFANAEGYIRVCFYIMGILLIGGGIQKIIRQMRPAERSAEKSTTKAAEK